MVSTWSIGLKLLPDFCFTFLDVALALLVQNGCRCSDHHIYVPSSMREWGEEKGIYLPFTKGVVRSLMQHITHAYISLGKNWSYDRTQFVRETGKY